MSVSDDRGLGKQLKARIPNPLFRFGTVLFNLLARTLPFRIKYRLGTYVRRGKAPYRFLDPGDMVVQVGCARDILLAGRSRAIYFASMVPDSCVVVVEADAENCATLLRVIEKYRLMNIKLVPQAAWNEKTTLRLLASRRHPASNVVEDVREISKNVRHRRQYCEAEVEADTLDSLIESAGGDTPRLVSVTTNGAELQIIEGMEKILRDGCEYVSLASTRPGLKRQMHELGYDYIARDDRGFCFRRREGVTRTPESS